MIRVVLADDHAMVRQGFRAVLEHHLDCVVVGEAATGPEAIAIIMAARPDVALVDLMLPGETGIAVTRHIKAAAPSVALLLVSMYSDLAYVDAAIRAGASGYILKEADAAELVAAVRAVAGGQRVVSAQLSSYWEAAAAIQGAAQPPDPYDTLTARERDVFAAAVVGSTAAHTAAQLTLSVRTVESYRASMMRKLGVRTQTELVHYAMRTGRMTLITDLPADSAPPESREDRR